MGGQVQVQVQVGHVARFEGLLRTEEGWGLKVKAVSTIKLSSPLLTPSPGLVQSANHCSACAAAAARGALLHLDLVAGGGGGGGGLVCSPYEQEGWAAASGALLRCAAAAAAAPRGAGRVPDGVKSWRLLVAFCGMRTD